MSFIYYKSKKLRGRVGMGEAVDTIISIHNKCLFVSLDGRTDGRTTKIMLGQASSPFHIQLTGQCLNK